MNSVLPTHDHKQVTMIITTIEDQFKKQYGRSYDWKNLLKSFTLRKIMEDNRLMTSSLNDINIVRKFIEDCIKNNDMYSMVLHEELDKSTYKLKRKNKYDVQDAKSLMMLVDNNPGGILVDEELTNFTYKDAKVDIERGINEKSYKRIFTGNPKDEHYYIFPRKIEIEHEVRQDNFKNFTMNEYLDMCRHLNSVDDDEENKKENKTNVPKESMSDPNYKLPGYLQEKQKWLKRNQKK